MGRAANIRAVILAVLGLALAAPLIAFADDEMETPVERTYTPAPPAQQGETQADADAKSAGCKSCHTTTDSMTMHETPAVVLGCADCHGGDARVMAPPGLKKTDPEYAAIRDRASSPRGDELGPAPRNRLRIGEHLDLQRHADFSAWPPNSLRIADRIFSAKVWSRRDRNRV